MHRFQPLVRKIEHIRDKTASAVGACSGQKGMKWTGER
jgi:hypothetical protein